MQQQDTSALILSELRDLRSAFNDNARDTGERLARLETSMHTLIGNGQPGRITLLETAVDQLKQFRWWMIGAAAGVSAVVSAVAWILRK